MKLLTKEPQYWLQSPLPSECSNDRVDVWRVIVDQSVSISEVSNLLSPDESVRASRFRFDRDRVRFVRCRAVLRSVLSRYLRMPAREICFEYQANGKPELAGDQNSQNVKFNVSHCADLALIAVSRERRLGVDIEKTSADIDITTLCERFFSPRERTSLQALPKELRPQAFFACWTRKEAFLKATGDGLSFPLASFSVSTHPDFKPVIEEICGDSNTARDWFLADLSPEEGYQAAVAVEGDHVSVGTYRWN